ncbi:hypothetical protein BDF21DRAFT_434203 [Thamnidium elegans]|uniref:Stress-associated endoplasmic reticulum protein n=1 Tax=Thamnidium elegans TaxID=101142 RepID=A0A8H7VTA5_9FUNG|nr:hypothetical protein INT48_002274 [Thamnidium elegans]KAI8047489.1 hypothetical protein BDF21DRAFT_434203 [Thamnidium elegans]
MASTPTLRQKNQLYKNRSEKGTVAVKASEKTKVVKKTNYSYWAIGILGFALFGGALLQLIDLIL